MTVPQDLAGRRAVVTGGGGGLGKAIAERLASAGAQLTIIDLPHMLDDLPQGWDAAAIDLASPEAQERLGALARRLGPTSIVVANAGLVPPWRRIDALDADEWNRVMTVNVWGVAVTLGAFAAALAESGHGSAIVTSSINGYRADPRQVAYSASKHAVIGVMRAAAQDLGPRGVRVNAIAPGPIATEALLSRIASRHALGQPDEESVLATWAGQTMLRRLATAADVANVAHFLCSDAAAGLTGGVYPIEAGLA